MGYRTTADEELKKAKESIGDAISGLSRIVIDECDGYDEYKSTYHDSLVSTLNELIIIRNRIR